MIKTFEAEIAGKIGTSSLGKKLGVLIEKKRCRSGKKLGIRHFFHGNGEKKLKSTLEDPSLETTRKEVKTDINGVGLKRDSVVLP